MLFDCGSCNEILLLGRTMCPLERTVQDILQHIHTAPVHARLELLCEKGDHPNAPNIKSLSVVADHYETLSWSRGCRWRP
jgi:hypothetical protein